MATAIEQQTPLIGRKRQMTKRPNVKKLLAALKYYADPANWRIEVGIGQRRGRKRVENDGGERARKALAQ